MKNLINQAQELQNENISILKALITKLKEDMNTSEQPN